MIWQVKKKTAFDVRPNESTPRERERKYNTPYYDNYDLLHSKSSFQIINQAIFKNFYDRASIINFSQYLYHITYLNMCLLPRCDLANLLER